jgi:hypothetical protein
MPDSGDARRNRASSGVDVQLELDPAQGKQMEVAGFAGWLMSIALFSKHVLDECLSAAFRFGLVSAIGGVTETVFQVLWLLIFLPVEMISQFCTCCGHLSLMRRFDGWASIFTRTGTSLWPFRHGRLCLSSAIACSSLACT